jgi:hypothetical protein
MQLMNLMLKWTRGKQASTGKHRQAQVSKSWKLFFEVSFKLVCVTHADAHRLTFRGMCQEWSLASVIECLKSGESTCHEMTPKTSAATDCYHHNESNRKGARLTRK